jgi:hypothetical protein
MNRRQVIKAGIAATATVALPRPSRLAAAGLADSPYAEPDTRQKAAADKRDFMAESKRIYQLHWAQTKDDVAALRRKHEKPVLGRVQVWDVLDKLALCVDATDYNLACTNQLIHVQQVVDGMERDGIRDQDLYLAALTHDLGKVLMLAGEAQENVVCANRPIGEYAAHAGLDQVVFQWNHDEFIYSRLRDHLPDHVTWLVRYHSIDIARSEPYMDERDRRYLKQYLQPFRRYDLGTKSIWRLPPANILDKYRPLIDQAFPAPIPI